MVPHDPSIPLDEPKVADWVRSLGLGAGGQINFRRIGDGQSNLTYLVSDEAGNRWVLRRPPLGHLLASAHDVAREHRILSALQGTDVPVFATHGLCTDPEVTDVPLMLVSYVDGVVLETAEDTEALPMQARADLGPNIARALAKIHAVDLEQVGLADLASHKPYAPRQLKRWAGQWEASKTRELPELEALTAKLAARVPEQHEVRLVHGDCHALNMIVDPQTAAIRAVIDWELCTLGDPIADLGTLLAYWPRPSDRPSMRRSASMAEGVVDREQLVEAYAAASGRDVSGVTFWHALGLWKVAIIIEGVRRRQLDVPENATGKGTFPAEAVDDLVALGHEVIDA